MEITPRTDRLALPADATRVLFLGDPHGDVAAFETFRAREARPGTALVSVGDNVGYHDGPTSSELVRRFAALGVRSVLGNHEHWMKDNGRLFLTHPPTAPDVLDPDAFEWCRGLPLRIELEHAALAGLRVAVQHSLFEEEDWDYLVEGNAARFLDAIGADVVFSGHSHRPAIYTVLPDGLVVAEKLDPESERPIRTRIHPGLRYVVDAGSLSRPELKRSRPPFLRGTFATLDLGTRDVRVESFAK